MPVTKRMSSDVSQLPEGQYMVLVQVRHSSAWGKAARELEQFGGGVDATNNISRIAAVRRCDRQDVLAIATQDSVWRILPIDENDPTMMDRIVTHLVRGNTLPSKLNIA